MSGPPAELVRALVDGPAALADLEWHDRLDSTNRRALELAHGGAPEITAVLADVQQAGRGRHGRTWTAPAGTSLLLSLLLRPRVPATAWSLLPLLTALALADVVERFVPGVPVSVKWPNDLLVAEHKTAGILVESTGSAAVVGIGVNVDWRGVDRPAELAGATSLAEAAGAEVDRWRLLAALIGVLRNRYATWQDDQTGFLAAYRQRCATLGRQVRVQQLTGEVLAGTAVGLAGDGALRVEDAGGRVHTLHAGDVEHLRGLS